MPNLVAVVVSAIASMIIGFTWYSKGVFGSQWMKLVGFSDKDMEKAKDKGMVLYMVVAFIAALVAAYVMGVIIDYAGSATVLEGALTGGLVWLGFAATIQIGSVLWEQKPVQLFAINTVQTLVNYAVIGAILAAWP